MEGKEPIKIRLTTVILVLIIILLLVGGAFILYKSEEDKKADSENIKALQNNVSELNKKIDDLEVMNNDKGEFISTDNKVSNTTEKNETTETTKKEDNNKNKYTVKLGGYTNTVRDVDDDYIYSFFLDEKQKFSMPRNRWHE